MVTIVVLGILLAFYLLRDGGRLGRARVARPDGLGSGARRCG